jgi:UDP-N-acetyl-D-glucosamine dehydrogenase
VPEGPDAFKRVGVIGLGYVGLPVALAFADKGLQVVGVDASPERVAMLREGRSYVDDISDDRVRASLPRLHPTGDYGDLRECQAVIISVPTPLTETGDPDMSSVVAAARNLGRVLQPDMLVVFESTAFPGATVEVVQPALEEESSLKAGQDFSLAYSPERIDPGNTSYSFCGIPKLVGGLTARCTARAAELYEVVVEKVVAVSSPMVAEMAKLLENTFRAVNIGLVNEMAILCRRMGISVWEVLDAASTKPFGFLRFDPGPGVGGHCIPVDPVYLAWKARQYNHEARIFQAAAVMNRSMPEHVVQIITEALNARGKPVLGSRILLLGVSYKAGVGDVREAPSLWINQRLLALGADVTYNDPYVPSFQGPADVQHSIELTAEALSAADCVVILTAHPDYDWPHIVHHSPLVVDTRGATRGLRAQNVVLL